MRSRRGWLLSGRSCRRGDDLPRAGETGYRRQGCLTSRLSLPPALRHAAPGGLGYSDEKERGTESASRNITRDTLRKDERDNLAKGRGLPL